MARQCWSYEPNPPKTRARSWIEKLTEEMAREEERLIWEELKNVHKDAFYREPALVPK